MKRIQRWILLIVILVIVIVLSRLFLISIAEKWITLYIKPEQITSDNILSIVSVIIGAFVTFVFNCFLKRYDETVKNRHEAPYLNFCSIREQSLTGIRNQRTHNSFEIELGKPQQEFRYVYAKIVNTGISSIVNCYIEKKHFPYQIKPQQEYPITFLVYEASRHKKIYKYKFKYLIEDGKNNKYSGTYFLKIIPQKRKAIFYMNKKQKEI